ncbi:TPA: galactofuranose ABC transporter, ATP-binding protein YtfT [Escherichia coli]
MTTDQHQEILRTEGLSKFFPGVKALDNVNFSLRRGEIMALLGENGAGKSTLIKALTGVYHADRGTIWLEGQAISPKNTAHAQQLGIGTVYQEVNLLPNMSVADNLFIGREPKRFGLLRRKEMEKRATELMASYGFSLDVREPLNRFSVAMQQIVAICRAIDLSAKVLILDEPTASLDTQEVELLFGLMRQLRDRGVSLIFVTHFLDQVYQVSDRITVLRNGSFVGCRETRELPQIELVKMMLGRELDTHALQRAGRTLLSDKPVAAFKNYGKKGTIAPFDLEVRPGEIVGLAGLLGSGRTETAEVIFGIKPADSGTALIKGKLQTLRSPHQASVLGIGFCPEDRKTDGIIAAASVRENIILALQAQRGWLRPISRKEQQEIAERFIRQLGIRTPSTEQPIEFLSGGNQQKVLLSRWLLTRPQFLILDEPTRGIDVGAHAEIIRLIETLCADGLALLVDSLVAPHFWQVVLQDGRLFGSPIDIFNRAAPVALLAIGMTLVIATGGIDLSVGAVMAIAGATTAAMTVAGFSLPIVLLSALGTGILAGLWNGILVAILKIQPFVATLILMVAGRGVAQLITSGQIVTFNSPDLSWFGSGSLLFLPTPVIIAVLTLLLFWLLTRKTALGMFIEAVGINIRAAKNAGVNTRIIVMLTYVLSGLCAAIAGIIVAADIRGADANNAGLWLELDAILAVVIGGGSLMGGRFNLLLSVVGALIIQGMNTGILLSGFPPEMNQVVKAVVVLCVLIVQSQRFISLIKGVRNRDKT